LNGIVINLSLTAKKYIRNMGTTTNCLGLDTTEMDKLTRVHVHKEPYLKTLSQLMDSLNTAKPILNLKRLYSIDTLFGGTL
jgi:hypothetical protein